jgi:hypothetical protein
MYRLLSAWAHGLQWPLATAILVPIEDGPRCLAGGSAGLARTTR